MECPSLKLPPRAALPTFAHMSLTVGMYGLAAGCLKYTWTFPSVPVVRCRTGGAREASAAGVADERERQWRSSGDLTLRNLLGAHDESPEGVRAETGGERHIGGVATAGHEEVADAAGEKKSVRISG